MPLSVDYKIDSEEYLKSVQDKDMDVEEETKCEVDRHCEYRKVGYVKYLNILWIHLFLWESIFVD